MENTVTVTLLLQVIFLCYGVLAINPGAQVRVSQHGIQYAGDVLIQKLGTQVTGQTLPDQSGQTHTPVGKVKYEFTQMRVTSFNPPTFSSSINPGQSLTVHLSGASISIHGHWRYKIKILFPISDSGSVDVDLRGITITQNIAFGLKNQRPSIASAGCSCHIDDVSVDIHTGLDWLYNLFRDKIEDIIRDTLQKRLCEIVVKEVNEDAEDALAKMKITVPVDTAFLNYSFIAPPKLGNGYVDASLSGEIFMKGDRPGQSGFSPAPFAEAQDTDHMLYIWLSDYVMDTLGYSLQKHGLLTYNLTKNDLKPKDQHYLNIMCNDSTIETKCVGSVVPQLRKIPKYANGTVEIGMWSTQVPKLAIIPGQLTGLFKGHLTFFVRTPEMPKPDYVFTINVTQTFRLEAKLKKNTITAKILNSRARVDIIDSTIGKIPDIGLQWVFNTINTLFVQDKLNKRGAEGFELPQIDHIDYINPQFQLMKDALLLKTDVAYHP